MGGTASTPERLLLSLTPYDGSPGGPASPTMAWPGEAIVAVGEAERWRSPHRSKAPQRASALQCSACVWHCAVTHDWFTICQPPSAVTDLNPVNGCGHCCVSASPRKLSSSTRVSGVRLQTWQAHALVTSRVVDDCLVETRLPMTPSSRRLTKATLCLPSNRQAAGLRYQVDQRSRGVGRDRVLAGNVAGGRVQQELVAVASSVMWRVASRRRCPRPRAMSREPVNSAVDQRGSPAVRVVWVAKCSSHTGGRGQEPARFRAAKRRTGRQVHCARWTVGLVDMEGAGDSITA